MRALDAIRPMGVGGEVKVFGLSESQIARRVKVIAKAAGLADWEFFSGHSGRVGMARRMAQNGAPTHEIERQGCPASTIFAGWRQSVLPVHLLGLAPLLGSVGPVAGDVKLQDDGVVHDPVNRRGGGHGVGKDALPLREDQV